MVHFNSYVWESCLNSPPSGSSYDIYRCFSQTFFKMGVHSSKYLVSIGVWTCLDPQTPPEKASRGSKNLLGGFWSINARKQLPAFAHDSTFSTDLGTIKNWTKSVDDYLFGGSLGP